MTLRLYFDEDSARHSLVLQLRARGADVVTAPEMAMSGKSDERQLEWAAVNGRALYSFNRSDFCRLHKAWIGAGQHHSGIILSRQDLSVGEQMRRLLRLISRVTVEQMQNRVEFLSAWSE